MFTFDYNLSNFIKNKYDFYIFYNDDERCYEISKIIQHSLNSHIFLNTNKENILDNSLCGSLNFDESTNKKYLFFVNLNIKDFIFFIKKRETKDSLRSKNKYILKLTSNISFKNFEKKYLLILQKKNILIIKFDQLNNKNYELWISQYLNILKYKVNISKIKFIREVCDNNIKIFIGKLQQINFLNKQKKKIDVNDFILQKKEKEKFSVSDFLTSILEKKVKKIFYIYKNLKKNTKNYTLFLFQLRNEIDKKKINKIFSYFNLIVLDIYVKNNKINQFWVKMLEIINNILLKEDSIKQKSFYDRNNIKSLI